MRPTLMQAIDHYVGWLHKPPQTRRSSRSTPTPIPTRSIPQMTRTTSMEPTRRTRRKIRRRMIPLGNPKAPDSKIPPAEHAASGGASSGPLFPAFSMPTWHPHMICGVHVSIRCTGMRTTSGTQLARERQLLSTRESMRNPPAGKCPVGPLCSSRALSR